ncbi:MAG: immunity protein Tsi6 family protein [Sphingobacterium sp.]|jgi:hypothetical protein|nr:immunity protein Tsi6 family protein [Sphingobacterium sp.]
MAIIETMALKERFPNITMYGDILKQLSDIKGRVVVDNNILTEDAIYTRYSLGHIAVKNFSLKDDPYAQKLSDIFGGLFDYSAMPSGDK